MKKFWYVHNRAKGNPTFRHNTKESAIAEAKRLAKLTDRNFYVLESVCKVNYNGEVDDVVEEGFSMFKASLKDILTKERLLKVIKLGTFSEWELKMGVKKGYISEALSKTLLNDRKKYDESRLAILQILKERDTNINSAKKCKVKIEEDKEDKETMNKTNKTNKTINKVKHIKRWLDHKLKSIPVNYDVDMSDESFTVSIYLEQ